MAILAIVSGIRASESWASYRYRHALQHVAENGLRLLGFLESAREADVDHHAVRESRNCQRFEVGGRAESAVIEIGHGLCRAIQREGSARRDAERERLRLA